MGIRNLPHLFEYKLPKFPRDLKLKALRVCSYYFLFFFSTDPLRCPVIEVVHIGDTLGPGNNRREELPRLQGVAPLRTRGGRHGHGDAHHLPGVGLHSHDHGWGGQAGLHDRPRLESHRPRKRVAGREKPLLLAIHLTTATGGQEGQHERQQHRHVAML
jgi:hypothetical protein